MWYAHLFQSDGWYVFSTIALRVFRLISLWPQVLLAPVLCHECVSIHRQLLQVLPVSWQMWTRNWTFHWANRIVESSHYLPGPITPVINNNKLPIVTFLNSPDSTLRFWNRHQLLLVPWYSLRLELMNNLRFSNLVLGGFDYFVYNFWTL